MYVRYEGVISLRGMTAPGQGSAELSEHFVPPRTNIFFLNMDVNVGGIMLWLGLGLEFSLKAGRCSSVKCCHDAELHVDAVQTLDAMA